MLRPWHIGFLGAALEMMLGGAALLIAVVSLGWINRLQRTLDQQKQELDALHNALGRAERQERQAAPAPSVQQAGSSLPSRACPPVPPSRHTEPAPEVGSGAPSQSPLPEKSSPSSQPDQSELATGEPAAVPAVAESPAAVDRQDEVDESGSAVAAGAVGKSPAWRAWEERLGAKLTVWIGAIALAMAGAYLVKYSFDNNLLSPVVRVSMGAAFGLALWLGAQFLHGRTPGVAAGLAAAGTADLLGCVLAATKLYGFVGPVWGFVMMAVVALAAVGLSLRHGQLVAVVGLIGGFLTPALIGAAETGTPLTFGYLFLLQVAVLAVARRRGWWTIAVLMLLGTLAWGGSFIVLLALGRLAGFNGTWLGLFVLASVGLFISVNQAAWAEPGADRSRLATAVNGLATLGALALLAVLAGVRGFTAMDWAFLGLLAAGVMLLARFRPIYLTLMWLTTAAVLVMLAQWAIGLAGSEVMQFFSVAGGIGALLTLGGFALMWGSRRSRHWATLASLTPLVVVLIGYGVDIALPGGWSWWMVAMALGGLVTLLATVVAMARGSLFRGTLVLSTYVSGAAVLFVIAAALGADRLWLGPIWAGILVAVALAGCLLRLPPLRGVVIVLAAGSVAQTLLDPVMYLQTYGPWVLLNELAAAHVIVLIALLAVDALYLQYRSGTSVLQWTLEGLAVLLTTVAAGIQVRHGFAPVVEGGVRLTTGNLALREAATYVVVWGSLASGLLAAVRWLPRVKLAVYAQYVGALATFCALSFLLLGYNPLWMSADLGNWIVWNGLLYVYGLPLALAIVFAWLAHRQRLQTATLVAGVVSLVMLVALVTLEVRHMWHGSDMALRPPTAASSLEWASYINLWLILGVIGVWVGRSRGSQFTLIAGLVVTLLGVAMAVLTLGLIANPLLQREPVGSWKLVNWLIVMYATPAALAGLAAWLLPHRMRAISAGLGVAALLLLFAFVSTQVRQFYHGNILEDGATTAAEWYTYSAVWVGLGLLLLAAGVISGLQTVRYASLAVMGLAVAKVFASDTAHLENLYRVLSLLGLGLSLLLLGFVYQRYVFRRS